jgi:dTDP-4-amino-4,6-dideoxygalactose transaminase
MGIVLALQALGLKSGQKVIVPSFTFIATAQAVLYAGGVPVFADCDDDLTLSPSDLEMLLARHEEVRFIIPVHTYGLPAHVEAIQAVVDDAFSRRGKPIRVLYDAAHAFGSAINGYRVGSFGDAEVFSLSVTKVLVTVEGGMISSRNSRLIRKIRKMRNYGIDENYNAAYQGLNGKMSEFHAIIGLYNLRHLDEYLAERQSKARYYINRIHELTTFETLPWPENVTHTFKDFTVLVPAQYAAKRDAVIEFLKRRGIETRAYFSPPVHEQTFFRRFADRPLPKTEAFARRVITLPFFTKITIEEMDYVVDALAEAERKVFQKRGNI